MNAFNLHRPFWKSKESKEQVLRVQPSTEPTDSKLQYILGITDAELKSARSRSVSSGSTIRLQSVSFSEATTAPNSSHRTTDDLPKLSPLPLLEAVPVSVLLEESSDVVTTILPKLRTYTSSSTLRSRYDSQTAPLNVPQQTSDSASRDFGLRKGTRSLLLASGQEIEHARQLRFFTSSKSRTSESRQSGRLSSSSNDKSTQVSPVLSVRSTPAWSQASQSSSPGTASAPASPHPMTPIKRFFSHRKTTGAQPIQQRTIHSNDTTPFAKIHVRKPKAGAKHWFDGLDGELSDDDESISEPKLGQNFANGVQCALQEITNNRDSTMIMEPSIESPLPEPRAHSSAIPSVPHRVTSSPMPTSHELPAHERAEELAGMNNKTQTQVTASKNNPDPMAGVDLNQQSVLSLSSSDDEDDGDELPSIVVQPAKSEPVIRESVMAETIVDSDVEIGLAHTIMTTPVEKVARSHPSRTERTGKVTYSAFPVPTRPRASSRTSQQIELPSEREMSERDIITAFPATPSEISSRRTSFRTSGAFSDNASVTSTRMMQVTKQEQRLLTAMRSKKAAMREADKAADRQCALKVLESGEDCSNPTASYGRTLTDDQSRLDLRLSNRYAPPRGPIHRRSLSGGATINTRGSGTTFQTSTGSYSRRESQATWRSDFSDDLQLPYSTYKDAGHTVILPASLHLLNQNQLERSTVRDTFLSMASDSSGQQRHSHIVMLDELDESLERESIPSQLFMETPFIGWDRIGVAAAH